jgi:hypothetical protein
VGIVRNYVYLLSYFHCSPLKLKNKILQKKKNNNKTPKRILSTNKLQKGKKIINQLEPKKKKKSMNQLK